MTKLRCLIRNIWIADTPEERVRQYWIERLVNQLKFPRSGLMVEKGLDQMPHIGESNLPNRRADLVCFSPGIHPMHALYPLLLIECKAVPLSQNMLKQAVGYNHYVKARFIAVVNQKEAKTGWYDLSLKEYCFIDHVPPYSELYGAVS